MVAAFNCFVRCFTYRSARFSQVVNRRKDVVEFIRQGSGFKRCSVGFSFVYL
jgi:hypothetical protein